jgi:hypothetical protein
MWFDKQKALETKTKILLGIIGVMAIMLLLAFKAVLSIASNKTIVIEVPNTLEPGKYTIGNTFASDSVFKMWAKIWVQTIGNFSYEDVDKKVRSIYEYIEPTATFKNKQKLESFIEFIKKNFITQSFDIKDIFIKKTVKPGLRKIIVYGILRRNIGGKEDKVSGLLYQYEIYAFVKNGQIFINSISLSLANPFDSEVKRRLHSVNSVDYEKLLIKAKAQKLDSYFKLKSQRAKQKEKEKKQKEKEKDELFKAKVEKQKKKGE